MLWAWLSVELGCCFLHVILVWTWITGLVALWSGFPNSKSRKRLTLQSLPVCPAIVSWWWENYLYLAPLSGGCRGPGIFTPLALSG